MNLSLLLRYSSIMLLATLLAVTGSVTAQTGFFKPLKEYGKGLFLLSELSINTPYVFGLEWQFNERFSLELLGAVPQKNRYESSFDDCKKNTNKPENIGYNAQVNSNRYFSAGIKFTEAIGGNEKVKYRNTHQFSITQKTVNYNVRYYMNYCRGSLTIMDYSNNNKILTLQYKYQAEIITKYPFAPCLFVAVGVSKYDYFNQYPSGYLSSGDTESRSFIKPQLDIGIAFKICVFSY